MTTKKMKPLDNIESIVKNKENNIQKQIELINKIKETINDTNNKELLSEVVVNLKAYRVYLSMILCNGDITNIEVMK